MPYIAVQFAAHSRRRRCCTRYLQDRWRRSRRAWHRARAPGSEASAMIFGEYFPNPGGKPFTDDVRALVSLRAAFFAEALGRRFCCS